MHQGEVLAAALGAFEGVAHHPLYPKPGVLADLGRHLMGSILPQGTAIAAVQALGALPNHHKINVTGVRQRRGGGGVKLCRPQVHVMVKSEPHGEQQAAL